MMAVTTSTPPRQGGTCGGDRHHRFATPPPPGRPRACPRTSPIRGARLRRLLPRACPGPSQDW